MHVAVVGHVEWLDFVRVPHLPQRGEIVHAEESWSEPGGGGAVAAAQLAKLAGAATFFTAVGSGPLGEQTHRELTDLGLQVHAAKSPEPQRRAITHLDEQGERTITVLGARLSPTSADPLPYDLLCGFDAVYLTAADPELVRMARMAKTLVATSRVLGLLAESGVYLDAVVGSSQDRSERYADGDLQPPPGLVVRTAGAAGGWFGTSMARLQSYDAQPMPGPASDSYGCGDSFAAGLTYALGAGLDPEQAVKLAGRCGAAVATGKGPYEKQLTAADLRG